MRLFGFKEAIAVLILFKSFIRFVRTAQKVVLCIFHFTTAERRQIQSISETMSKLMFP